MRVVAEEIKDLVAEYGGVNSSEHGDGLARSEFNREIFGDELYEAMRQVKQVFDPDNLMNPGKIVDAPSMTDNLRDRGAAAGGTVPDPPAVRSGGRHARRRGPLHEHRPVPQERHGRHVPLVHGHPAGGALHPRPGQRTGQGPVEPNPREALGDERLHEILDLCLMCKACKSECPLGVDMATLKSEALSHHHDAHGVPLRSRVFGSIRGLNRLGSATAPLSNLPGRLRPVRWLMDRLLGIDAAAAAAGLRAAQPAALVPRPAARVRPPAAGQGAVSYLADSFTTYTEPEIGQAAIELLERAGWQVRLESGGCCGRSSLSKGLVDDAKEKARGLAHALTEGSGPDTPIVGCEPSCLMTLRDEHLALLPDDPAVRSVCERVRQVEELLTEAIDDGRLRLAGGLLARRTPSCSSTATATRRPRWAPPPPSRC